MGQRGGRRRREERQLGCGEQAETQAANRGGCDDEEVRPAWGGLAAERSQRQIRTSLRQIGPSLRVCCVLQWCAPVRVLLACPALPLCCCVLSSSPSCRGCSLVHALFSPTQSVNDERCKAARRLAPSRPHTHTSSSSAGGTRTHTGGTSDEHTPARAHHRSALLGSAPRLRRSPQISAPSLPRRHPAMASELTSDHTHNSARGSDEGDAEWPRASPAVAADGSLLVRL